MTAEPRWNNPADPRWMPLVAAHKRWTDERTGGDADDAALDLTKALAQGLPCLVRSGVAMPESNPVGAAVWCGQFMLRVSRLDGVSVVHQSPHAKSAFVGHVFFVWQPAFDALLSGKLPPKSPTKSRPRKDGCGRKPDLEPHEIKRASVIARDMLAAVKPDAKLMKVDDLAKDVKKAAGLDVSWYTVKRRITGALWRNENSARRAKKTKMKKTKIKGGKDQK